MAKAALAVLLLLALVAMIVLVADNSVQLPETSPAPSSSVDAPFPTAADSALRQGLGFSDGGILLTFALDTQPATGALLFAFNGPSDAFAAIVGNEGLTCYRRNRESERRLTDIITLAPGSEVRALYTNKWLL
ncbi:MAG: hypothetical protein WC712_05475, partial [Candidatus Brocadiia bacterium]